MNPEGLSAGTVITAIVTTIVSVYTAWSAKSTTRDNAKTAPYEAMARRLEKLEVTVEAQRESLSHMQAQNDRLEHKYDLVTEKYDRVTDLVRPLVAWILENIPTLPVPTDIALGAGELAKHLHMEEGDVRES